MLSAAEARLLDRLTLGTSSASPFAASSGLRRTGMPGVGVEFQDFRRYLPGDDPRQIDWTVEARLRQLVIRVSRAEGHLRLHLLIDVSRSMSIGSPDKLSCARKIAAALCYVAVARRDAVAAALFDDAVRHHVPLGTGRRQLSRVFEASEAATFGSGSDINGALTKYAAVVRGPGLAVVCSDFFQEPGAFEGLRYLLYRGLTPVLIHVLAPEELDPGITDDTDLVDVENPDAPPLAVDASAARAYLDRLGQLSEGLRTFCIANRLPYLQVCSSDSFERLLHACQSASLVAAYA